jgi:hypothetical protein
MSQGCTLAPRASAWLRSGLGSAKPKAPRFCHLDASPQASNGHRVEPSQVPCCQLFRRAEREWKGAGYAALSEQTAGTTVHARLHNDALLQAIRLMLVDLMKSLHQGALDASIAHNLVCKRNCCCDQLDDEATVAHCAAESDPRHHPLVSGSSVAIATPSLSLSECNDVVSTVVRIWTRQCADWASVGFQVVVGLLHWVFQPPVACHQAWPCRPSKSSTDNHAFAVLHGPTPDEAWTSYNNAH